ncbi:hypothetical protein KSS87_003766 [Heliosperma pusillum]|nr:hypothetical protein KSS87_003766 [Heliosperma pusillum]
MAASSSSSFWTLSSSTSSKPSPPLLHQKTNFHGLSLQGAKTSLFNPLVSVARTKSSYITVKKGGIEINAKAAGAAKTVEGVEGGGNAAKAGLKTGDQVLYTSSFFGDELWPADKLGFTKTAIQAKPDSVYFVINRGPPVDVKRLPKRPAPPRFGRKLSDAQKARATHICLDCGFIYTLPKPFEEQPDDYACPQCIAPKKRFARYDVNTGKAIGGGLPPFGVIIGLVAGLAAVGALLVYGLQ